MKRNLNAIIALVLVVVMVFPMSIFVGAADALTAKQSDGTAFTSGETLEVPTGNSKALVFTVPTGYGNLKAEKTTDQAASTAASSGTTVTFTGAMVEKTDTYKISATKGSGTSLSTLSFTVKVKAVDIAVEGDITVSCTKTSYNPGETISTDDFKVEGKLNTADQRVTWAIENGLLTADEKQQVNTTWVRACDMLNAYVRLLEKNSKTVFKALENVTASYDIAKTMGLVTEVAYKADAAITRYDMAEICYAVAQLEVK